MPDETAGNLSVRLLYWADQKDLTCQGRFEKRLYSAQKSQARRYLQYTILPQISNVLIYIVIFLTGYCHVVTKVSV
jgi:hypothetical protein